MRSDRRKENNRKRIFCQQQETLVEVIMDGSSAQLATIGQSAVQAEKRPLLVRFCLWLLVILVSVVLKMSIEWLIQLVF